MSLPVRSRLLQLLPPAFGLHRETLALADHALNSARSAGLGIEAYRQTVRRGLWDAARALHTAHDSAQVIHAVGTAIWACPGARCPVVYTPDLTPTASEAAALRLVARTAPLIGVTSADLAPLRRCGVRWTAISRIDPPTRPTAAHRPKGLLRAGLGLLPTDHVVLALGDTRRHSGHERLLWAVAILAMTDPRWKLLASGTGDALPRLRRFASHLSVRESPLVLASDDTTDDGPHPHPDELPHVCDLAVFAADGPSSTLELREALLAEVPVVATPSPAASRLLPRSLILPDRRPRALAQHLLELRHSQATTLQSNLEVVSGAALLLRESLIPLAPGHPDNPWAGLFASLVGSADSQPTDRSALAAQV